MPIPDMSPHHLQRAWQSAARCDALMTPEESMRAYRHDPAWSNGIAMARFDNGAGDHVIGFFTAEGKAVLKGFDHESELSPHAQDEYAVWPGIYDGLPQELLDLLHDEAVDHEDVTFCCWSVDGVSWSTGTAQIAENMEDGAGWLLPMVQMDAQQFIEWAKHYYGDQFGKIGEAGLLAAFEK